MAGAVKKAYGTSDLRDLSQQFKMLADPMRLIVFGGLAKTELNVTVLAQSVGMSPGAVSHHLSVLRLSMFVEKRRDGRSVIYTLTDIGRSYWDAVEKSFF